MQATEIIIKKRNNQTLTKEEIQFFIQGYSSGEIPDYQAAAWAMAVMINGMSDQEVSDLTMAMVNSGDTLDLSDFVKISVDKHSTGGVGDKTSLVALPIVAACGLKVGKMSGRGLGFSGGTLDKMESIPGFRTDLNLAEIKNQLRDVGVVLTGQTSSLAPADGKLYALRDVTGTVPSIPLIASSIMSKKIAAGSQAIVLDVKIGLGAFMENLEDAKKLGDVMKSIGKMVGRKVVVLLSDMNQPLGNAVGNALEVQEAVETLKGNGPSDLVEHCLVICSHMLVLGEISENLKQAGIMAEKAVLNGSALEKFRIMVSAQGGDAGYIEDFSKFPRSRFCEKVIASSSGYVSLVNARTFGEAAVMLGAGRTKKGEEIDHSVGFLVKTKVGDRINKGDHLYSIYANNKSDLVSVRKYLINAIGLNQEKVDPLPLFYN